MNILEQAKLSAKQSVMQSQNRLNKSQANQEYYEQDEMATMEEDFNNRVSNFTNHANGKVTCSKHQDKEIEYFCKICHSIVCPKCMFAEHNGHELAQLEDVTNIIK